MGDMSAELFVAIRGGDVATVQRLVG